MRLLNRFASMFGYDATEHKNRRKPAPGLLRSEDDELTQEKRRTLVSGTRDLRRNFEAAAWAVRKHLDFVSSFSFDAQTGVPALDEQLERLVRSWSANCDVAGRHPLPRFLRLAEACRTLDGDLLTVKIADGRIQAIESDRIRDSVDFRSQAVGEAKTAVQGVQLDEAGRTVAYAVHRRTAATGFQFERLVPAENAELLAYYDRFDQVRGVSPLASAYNRFRDVYENFDYALAKSKVAQLFGLALFRDATDAPAPVEESENSSADAPKYDIDFDRGPVLLDLDPGDRAEFLENKTPSVEFASFTEKMISLALKALDIPYSFYDEAYTNFFGGRAALMLYLQSCKSKREDLRRLLRHLTAWRIALWVRDRQLILPAGMLPEDVAFEWIPDGVPWWDPSKEIAGDIAAISATLRSRREIRKEKYGDDWFKVVDQLAEEEAYLREKQVTVTEPMIGVSVGVGPQQNEENNDARSDQE